VQALPEIERRDRSVGAPGFGQGANLGRRQAIKAVVVLDTRAQAEIVDRQDVEPAK
jgi:hypothetical protein